jgi:hypothetical protein
VIEDQKFQILAETRATLKARCSLVSKASKLQRLLTDRGTEYCGNPERHGYELYLAIEDIDHMSD